MVIIDTDIPYESLKSVYGFVFKGLAWEKNHKCFFSANNRKVKVIIKFNDGDLIVACKCKSCGKIKNFLI